MANAKKTPDMDEFLKEIGVDPKDASITSKKRILAAMLKTCGCYSISGALKTAFVKAMRLF